MNSRCSLCLREEKLTKEHVPAKSQGNIGSKEAEFFWSNLSSEFRKKPKQVQNGYWIRTTCTKCNNELLGEYNKSLTKFSEEVEVVFEKYSSVKSVSEFYYWFNVCGESVAKAVIGMCLASDQGQQLDEATELDVLRQYFFGKAETPAPFNVFVWLYPYEKMEVQNDFLLSHIQYGERKFTRVSAIKAKPLGFMIADCETFQGTTKIPFTRESRILLNIIPNNSQNFPIFIDGSSFALLGESAINSVVI